MVSKQNSHTVFWIHDARRKWSRKNMLAMLRERQWLSWMIWIKEINVLSLEEILAIIKDKSKW